MISEELISGVIPEDLENKGSAVRTVTRFSRRAVPLTAMLIAAAWRDNFQRSDYSGWADWCLEYAGIDKADKRAHLHAIGRMLLAVKALPRFVKTFNLLFELDSEKLLCLTRLVKPGPESDDVSEVITFANHYPVATMSRDRMRRLVKRWQEGNPAGIDEDPEDNGKQKMVQQDLPGFERSLDLLHDLKPETAAPMIKTAAAAEKAMWGGAVLLQSVITACSDRAKAVDPEDLESLKATLLDMVDAIDRIRDRQAEADAEGAEEIAAGDNENTENKKRFTQNRPRKGHCRSGKTKIGFDIAAALRDAETDPEDCGGGGSSPG